MTAGLYHMKRIIATIDIPALQQFCLGRMKENLLQSTEKIVLNKNKTESY